MAVRFVCPVSQRRATTLSPASWSSRSSSAKSSKFSAHCRKSRRRPSWPWYSGSSGHSGTRVDDDVFGEVRDHAFDSLLREGRESAAHDLDALLRHRLLRQPGGFEGLIAVAVVGVVGYQPFPDPRYHGEG